MLALNDVNFVVLVGGKTKRGKTRSSSLVVLSRPKLAAVEQFQFICLLEIRFLWSTSEILAVFLRSITLFASVKGKAERGKITGLLGAG